MILLVGATGRLGKAVAQRFLHNGTQFRAACRDVSKAKWLGDQGVEVMRYDAATGDGLANMLSGTTQVICCIHGLLGKSRHSIEETDVRGQASLIDACVNAGIHKFIFISALGASADHPSEFWQAKAKTEQHLRASGLKYIILRPSAFMDLYAHDLIGAAVIAKKVVFLLGDGRSAKNMVAVADVADAVLIALSRHDLSGQTIEVGGPENLTDREVAQTYSELSGNTPKLWVIPDFALKVLASTIAPFHAGIGRVLRNPLQTKDHDKLDINVIPDTTLLGIKPQSLTSFAQTKIAIGKATA